MCEDSDGTLDEERRRRCEALLRTARALPESDRNAFLEAACSEDQQLRAAVEAALQVPESEDSGDATSPTRPPDVPVELSQLGPYRLLRPIGSGGMGIVYEAKDTCLQRRVAVKVLSQVDPDEGNGQEFPSRGASRIRAGAPQLLQHL